MQKPQQKKPIINPFETLKDSSSSKNPEQSIASAPIFKEIPQVGNNATKINFDQLHSSYAGQDKQSIADIQKSMNPEQVKEQNDLQFFRKYKREEEEYYLQRKKEEEEKKQQEELQEQQQLKQQEEERLARNAESTPQGKKKKSIMGKIREKATALLPPEMKPGGGKQ
jgi:hypothetical protein